MMHHISNEIKIIDHLKEINRLLSEKFAIRLFQTCHQEVEKVKAKPQVIRGFKD